MLASHQSNIDRSDNEILEKGLLVFSRMLCLAHKKQGSERERGRKKGGEREDKRFWL
jgi:hypothetical protein